MRASGVAKLTCAGLLGLLGCGSATVARRIDSVATVAERAGKQGARRCAPEELALARVHLEFARLELRQGEPVLADRHLTLAEPNAKAAVRLSESADCTRPADAARGSDGARTSSPSRLLGAVGENRDLGRGEP